MRLRWRLIRIGPEPVRGISFLKMSMETVRSTDLTGSGVTKPVFRHLPEVSILILDIKTFMHLSYFKGLPGPKEPTGPSRVARATGILCGMKSKTAGPRKTRVPHIHGPGTGQRNIG